MSVLRRFVPFSPSTTAVQGATYLLCISLFSISFLVFLNSSVSFVVTDLIGQKKGVGDVVGTLGFVDELIVLVACPAWGLASDRLGVRWVAVLGYIIIGVALMVFVQARNVYPELVLARILFAVGASASATMVTAILPSLTDETEDEPSDDLRSRSKSPRNQRHSMAFSVESELTITPERYTRTLSNDGVPRAGNNENGPPPKSAQLAGFVGLFTGAGALVALLLFLPLPARFSQISGVTQADAVTYSFYVVGGVALVVAVIVFFGLRGIKGEEGKGWKLLFGTRTSDYGEEEYAGPSGRDTSRRQVVPYVHLLKDSIFLAFTDSRIALGYLGGFVARASTVAISLFIPLFVNTFFISNGFCQGSPHDPSPELKKECRSAYILSSILTGVAQMAALLCAPVFGYLSHRGGKGPNIPVIISSVFGMVGYVVLPQLSSPEFKDEDGRGGSPWIFLVVILIGISQIGAIVCSLSSLSEGVLATDTSRPSLLEPSLAPLEDESTEADPLIRISTERNHVSRVQLKGSIAGVYSLSGGLAILLLTKLGGFLFDKMTTGAPFYMMAAFNGVLLLASLGIDASQTYSRFQ
ncbi:hypothetical protein NLU13_2752 [Sarocladium strictum]|uniref:MFS transporter n=1 Tax=Sarocladium strictum TaxID=5046 RepID=A0AA39L9L4_SARSR|nr:hypothetical protein NLU13_2752 [Sarocladium strictum]